MIWGTRQRLFRLQLHCCAMTQQSGSHPGGGGRGCDVLGDRESGANTFSDGSGVDGSGGDIAMGLGESSNSEMNSGLGFRGPASANGRGVVAPGGTVALTGALGSQAPSGGLGRPSEAVAGAGREQGAQAQSLEELMAMILQNAGQGDGQAAGSGSAWRDDVSARLAWQVAWRGWDVCIYGLECV